MQKVLLIDTNVSSFPIFQFLIKSGYKVFVAGGNPSDHLAKTALDYIQIDYSNIDEIRNFIDSFEIDFIVPGCNDLSYKIASQLNADNSYYGLDSIEITETINDKQKFREFANQINLPVPKVLPPEQSPNNFPCIVKPVDAYSGRGITIINEANKNSLPKAVENAKAFSPSEKYIIEEYIDGQLYSHSAFITNGKILIDFIVEEHCTANPFVVDTSRVVYNFSCIMLNKIREEICLMVKHLNLTDGLVHTQFIKHNNTFWIIEVTRRCPGDLYSQLIEMSTGFPYVETYTKAFLNKESMLGNEPLQCNYIMRHTISQQQESIYTSLKFNLPVSIESFIPLSMTGDNVKASPFGRIALLFTRSKSSEDLSMLFNTTISRNLYFIV